MGKQNKRGKPEEKTENSLYDRKIKKIVKPEKRVKINPRNYDRESLYNRSDYTDDA